eukprot:11784315-Ditylum_brightwellii.AAC.1
MERNMENTCCKLSSNNMRLGLSKQKGRPCDARIHQQSKAKIWTPKTKTSATCTTQTFPMHYGAKTQWVEEDLSEPLAKMSIERVQDIVGTLLYYARAVGPMLAAALSTIASQQATGTKKWKKYVTNC